jgi:hypothetical protein
MLVVMAVVFGEMKQFTLLQIVHEIFLTCVTEMGTVSFESDFYFS